MSKERLILTTGLGMTLEGFGSQRHWARYTLLASHSNFGIGDITNMLMNLTQIGVQRDGTDGEYET